MPSYLRSWELTISPFTINADGSYRFLQAPIVFRELRMTFNLVNTLLGDPTTGSFQLYNINHGTRTILSQFNCLISFKAGYGSLNQIEIFRGEITNSYELRAGTDNIYNIWARDSARSLETYRLSIPSFQVDKTPIEIIDTIAQNTPNINNDVRYIGAARSVLNSAPRIDNYAFNGSVASQLNTLTKQYSLRWHCRFNELRILSEEDNTVQLAGDNSPFEVSLSTGLLTRPKVDYVGVYFNHLLNGRFHPDALINITPLTVERDFGNELYVPQDNQRVRLEGTFRVMEAIHKGDTRGNLWRTEVKAYSKV